MSSLWDILEQMDRLTKQLIDEEVSEEWVGLSREERMAAVRKLRETYLRIGHVLEDWKDSQTSESRE